MIRISCTLRDIKLGRFHFSLQQKQMTIDQEIKISSPFLFHGAFLYKLPENERKLLCDLFGTFATMMAEVVGFENIAAVYMVLGSGFGVSEQFTPDYWCGYLRTIIQGSEEEKDTANTIADGYMEQFKELVEVERGSDGSVKVTVKTPVKILETEEVPRFHLKMYRSMWNDAKSTCQVGEYRVEIEEVLTGGS